jgi:DNA-binding CsgD family transcriptional regulator
VVLPGGLMAKSTAARAAARIRQLSCFGLSRETAIPELLRELHAVIPSFSNTFFFADRKGVVDNIYFETPEMFRLFPYYRQEFHERRERELKGVAFSEASRTQFGVHDRRMAVDADEATFQRSDYYNLIIRPAGYNDNFLRLYFRDHGRVLGGVNLWRSKTAFDWTAEEKRRLASLYSFFVHALTGHGDGEAPLVDSGESGLIVATADGRPVHLSAEGRRLLFLATHPRSIADTATSRPVVLPPAVAALCRNLSAIFSDDAVAAAPIHRLANVWGGFSFRAEWLDQDRPGSGLVGITLSRKLPMPIRLVRSVRNLSLSPRQTEVCVLMASGASNEAIAERLGISRHTAGEHARWIFNKLDVHSRAELVSRLLST